MNFATIKELLVDTFKDWNEDKAPRLAAALAYYTIFSLAPLLVIAIAIAGFFFGADSVRGEVVGQIGGMVGPDGAQAIDAMLDAANSKQSTGLLASLLGIGALLLGAGGLFGQLQDALNTIWEVAPRPDRGFWGMLKDRFLSFSMVLGTGFLLLVSLLISTALSAVGGFVAGDGFDESIIWQLINFVVSAAVTMGLFTLIFKLLPDVEISWRDVLLGAALTTALFLLGRFLLSLYLARSAPGSAYGAAGSLVIILIWIYYTAQILFFGAEFTQVYARRFGSKIVPSANAVSVTEETRANEGMPSKERLEQAARAKDARAGQPATAAQPAATTRQPTTPRSPDASAVVAARQPAQTRAGLLGLAGVLALFGILARRRK